MSIYYRPEEFGLEIFGTVDIYPPDYSYNLFVVWREPASGDLLWAYDAGCSCSSPFEELGLTDLERGNGMEAITALDKTIEYETWSDEAYTDAKSRSLDLVTKLAFA